jgi:hypothetical protein
VTAQEFQPLCVYLRVEEQVDALHLLLSETFSSPYRTYVGWLSFDQVNEDLFEWTVIRSSPSLNLLLDHCRISIKLQPI